MTKQPRGPRPKHVPQRTCIACRQAGGKRGLVRLVRTAEGTVEVDLSGKKTGRGAYLHPLRSCWEVGLKGSRIEQALRTKLSQADRLALQEYAQSLPEADPAGEAAAGSESQASATQVAGTE
jgi:predicted RNA-binding protein YlxR (DUF448 family)